MQEDKTTHIQKPLDQERQSVIATPSLTSGPRRRSYKKLAVASTIIVLLGVSGLGWWHFRHSKKQPVVAANIAVQLHSTTPTTNQQPANVQDAQLDVSKDYGNKYASGVLPVGDGRYTTTGAKKGYVYACSQYAQNLANTNGGAMARGSWFTNNNTEYDINKKIHVQGNVMWSADFSNKVSGDTRTIITNDLPNHQTGIFPIAASDPAYQYDRNPNSIQGQTFTYSLPVSPTYSGTPHCESGSVGIMLTGVALFNALDAGGRDAGAWEVQDSCNGHPQSDGIYHYHTLSGCIKNVSVHTVIGYALDGFPITGPDIGTNNILTTNDLDECHGIVSQINLDGKRVTMYHYVMTQDFPYSISCFRGTPMTPPGQNPQAEHQQPQQPARPPRMR